MSTDKTPSAVWAEQESSKEMQPFYKTLAEVQPGGMVRLGDQAERARFEAFLSRNPLTALCAGTAWEVWQAALSAQPSPGGQGDARALIQRYDAAGAKFRESLMDDHYSDAQRVELRRELTAVQDELLTALSAQPSLGGQGDELVALVSKWRNEASAYDDQQAKETGYEVDWTYDAKARALDRAADELEAALAARQPVYVQGCDELRARTESERAAYMEGLEEGKKIAARQPVGQEPVEFDYPEFHQEGMGCGLEDRGITDRYEAMRYGFDEALDQMATILASIGPLYAAPPAQAVDLGNVIEQIAQQWDGCNYDAVGETIDVGQAIRAAGKRLIDSKAVGK